MKGARHPAFPVAIAMLAVALLAIPASGCGSSGREASGEGAAKTAAPQGAAALACAGAPAAGIGNLRVSGVDCATGRDVLNAWAAKKACSTPAGASQASCTAGAYRCLGIATERGLAVNCARPGRSISFVAERN